MGKARNSWSYSAGERGRNRVRAYEDGPGGLLLLEFYESDPQTGRTKRIRVSLGSKDRSLAKSKADQLAAEIGKGVAPQAREATLDTLFDIYLREVTRTKGDSKQRHDKRCVALFRQSIGGSRKASSLNRRDWDRFIHDRRSGLLRLSGRVGKHAKSGVRNRQIAYDLKFLLSVLNWATRSGDGRGDMLLDRNPLVGLPLPKEENPRRPLLSEAQYVALQAIAVDVSPLFKLALTLAHETGHRIGAIRLLRWRDIDFETCGVRWRAENDKIGLEHWAPLSSEALNALEHERKRRLAIGDGWVFPSPEDPTVPCSRHLARDWWKRAEALAKIDHGERLGWHSLRRKFVNDLKETPLADLVRLGGWKNPQTVTTIYQQPDQATMRRALERRAELRAAAG